MPKTKVEVYDKDQLIYPYIESDHVTFSNGMKVSEMLDQSISMPTVTHEDLSFKVGVGDQDVSSAIVDSSVAEMTIKGKTYQNILPEPSTHVLTNNKEMFKVNEGLDPSVEIVDGVSKSAILSGNTLVNLIKSVDKSAGVYTKENEYHIIEHKSDTNYISFKLKCRYKLDTTKNYMLFMNVKENTLTSVVRTTTPSLLQDKTLFSEGFVGLYKLKFTPSNSDNDFIWLRTNSGSSGKIVFSCMVIEYQEGMENWDVPYFQGMQSVKMPVLKSIGSNIFDGDNSMELGAWKADSSPVTVSNEIRCKNNFTPFPNGLKNGDVMRIVLSDTSINSNTNMHVYDENKTRITTLGYGTSPYIEGTDFINGVSTITIHDVSKCKYFSFRAVSTNTECKFAIMVNTSAPYELYKTNILSCELVPMNQSMFEQGSFSESTPANTQSYENIKLNSGSFYNNRIRTKGTYKVVKGATYSGQLNNGYGIFVCYCKNGLYSAKDKGWIDETNFTFTVPNDCDEMFFALRKTNNSAITPSDYPLIGLKIHQEVVLRSLPNGVKDTLNLMTGEYVQRIEEHVLDGTTNNASRDWNICWNDYSTNTLTFEGYTPTKKLINTNGAHTTTIPKNFICDKVKVLGFGSMWQNGQAVDRELSITTYTGGQLIFVIEKSKLTTMDVSGFKQWLSQNPVTIQYELETPVVKTVDLSSSGNWEKIVLDGSEAWQSFNIVNGNGKAFFHSDNKEYGFANIFSDKLRTMNDYCNEPFTISGTPNNRAITVCLNSEIKTLEQFKQYLSQNPITVWYQTITSQANSIKEMLFFKDGHIIQSSGADNSLIPTLDYQAKTSNSYVMDLMKANTRYTMKAKSASGTFTIDGTSYNIGTNTTFTTPSSMINKFLVMSNKTNEEVMILEGDVVSKSIPYFKGIKSAFEDESKIEVLSTGKNLFDKSDVEFNYAVGNSNPNSNDYVSSNFIAVKPSTEYVVNNSLPVVCAFDVNKEKIALIKDNNSGGTFTTPSNCYFIRIRNYTQTTDHQSLIDVAQLEESPTQTTYEPYKSNNTKIPLSSPLRSLPNGVCDELIIDRMKKKATLIQRVGFGILGRGGHGYSQVNSSVDTNLYQPWHTKDLGDNVANSTQPNTMLCDKLLVTYESYAGRAKESIGMYPDTSANFTGCLLKSTLGGKTVKEWMELNSITVYYQLATPIITEVDLEGFPYVYKDGHIFLNSEITPTIEIIYSVNQCQQISASNEDIIRHEKELTYLQKLIAQYVQVDYESALLSLKV